MQRVYVLAAAMVLSACASAPRGDIPAGETSRSDVRIETAGVTASSMNMQLTREAEISTATLTASPDSVWKVLPAVFAELEIPVSGVQSSNRLLTARGERLRRVAGRGISSFFDCPGSYGNAAANSDVYFTVHAQVLPGETASASAVRTQVEAMARSSTSGNTVPCTSRGALERAIMERLSAKLTPPA